MAAVFGHVERDDYEVRDADGDLVGAAGAHVRLARLEGMHERNLEVVVGIGQPNAAHSNNRMTTTTAAITNA